MKYIVTKLVEAEATEKDGEQGYLVRYAGGASLWIPEELFNKTYTTSTNLNFSQALDTLKHGGKAHRPHWENGYLVIEASQGQLGKILTCVENEVISEWIPTSEDLLADDWITV